MNSSNTSNSANKKAQEIVIYNVFMTEPMTMKQASIVTGIDRANICRYCKNFREQNKVCYLKKVRCPITKHYAFLITTDWSLFVDDMQMKFSF
jgi:hypothetical protein